jgi:hypothetical protein
MNFIEAVNKFYKERDNGKRCFITKKGWVRSQKKNGTDAHFYALGLDDYRNLRSYLINHRGETCGSCPLDTFDYKSDDWAVFDADAWEIREEA